MHPTSNSKTLRAGATPRRFITALCCSLLLAGPAAAQELETLALVDEAPGNITVTPDGTVVLTVHPSLPSAHLALQLQDGTVSPFPDAQWGARERADGTPGLRPMLGLRADREGRVWLLASGGTAQLYAWDLAAQQLVHDFSFEGLRIGFNDIALALSHGKIILSDTTNGGLAVLDLASGALTQRLLGHSSMQAEDVVATIDGTVVGNGGQPLRGGLNPLTIDAQEEWVYYGAMSGTKVWRVRVADLLDSALDDRALAARVEHYADKVPSAGITIDDAGNIYITDIQAHGIGVAAPGQPYRLLVSDPQRLAWADGISVGPDGYIYTANNQLYRNFGSHRAGGPPTPPFYITRFKALAPTTVGR
jgi:sugar lactone lactonase YvrE